MSEHDGRDGIDTYRTAEGIAKELRVYTSDDAPRIGSPSSTWNIVDNVLMVNVSELDALGKNFAARRDACRRTSNAHAFDKTLHGAVAAGLAKAEADTWECARAELAALIVRLSAPPVARADHRCSGWVQKEDGSSVECTDGHGTGNRPSREESEDGKSTSD